jgi:uncharacterized protein YbjT (DUF2867 family)
MLGGKIARALLAKGDAARVRAMVRPGGAPDDRTQAKLDELARLGADLVLGELADHSSLTQATRDMEVVVSALQGGPEVIVEGQLACWTRPSAMGCGA